MLHLLSRSCVCAARDGLIHFADMEPSLEVLAQFSFGGDNGIMSLELLSIALGVACLEYYVTRLCVLVLLLFEVFQCSRT